MQRIMPRLLQNPSLCQLGSEGAVSPARPAQSQGAARDLRSDNIARTRGHETPGLAYGVMNLVSGPRPQKVREILVGRLKTEFCKGWSAPLRPDLIPWSLFPLRPGLRDRNRARARGEPHSLSIMIVDYFVFEPPEMPSVKTVHVIFTKQVGDRQSLPEINGPVKIGGNVGDRLPNPIIENRLHASGLRAS
jgi:hypothetical protein